MKTKRTCQPVDFAEEAEEHKSNSYTICIQSHWNNPLRLGKGTGERIKTIQARVLLKSAIKIKSSIASWRKNTTIIKSLKIMMAESIWERILNKF